MNWIAITVACLWGIFCTGIAIYYGLMKGNDKALFIGMIGLLVTMIFLQSTQIERLKKQIGGK